MIRKVYEVSRVLSKGGKEAKIPNMEAPSIICATQNPHTLHEVPLHSEKIGVWCALSQMGNVGPLYFDSSEDGAVYRDPVQQFVAMF